MIATALQAAMIARSSANARAATQGMAQGDDRVRLVATVAPQMIDPDAADPT